MQSLTLLTDLYQLTMAYGYWQLNMHERPSVFHLLYRKNPFGGTYALSCGLGSVIDYLENFAFSEDDLNYLASLRSANAEPLWPQAFLDYLRTLKFSCSIAAIPEGTVVAPNEPLLRITGPLLQGQLLETALLNMMNFQTLIATKASRVCTAAQSDEVIEFGMRRAQGPDGALSASRAAYIGGCVATSNTLAGKVYGIPVRGTHAHSWVSAFDSESQAFAAYAKVLPQGVVLLVDTYDTLQGVANAIQVGQQLRAEGRDLAGIRLDSGDMAALSIAARKLLDAAGFNQTQIVASNSLDEYKIAELKAQGAKISVWGVGTHLVTAYDYPALDGVYKLSALQNEQGVWQDKLKISEDPIKVSNPGTHQVRRFYKDQRACIDVIYDLPLGIAAHPEVALLSAPGTSMRVEEYDHSEDLLVPIFENGRCVYQQPPLAEIRARSLKNVAAFLNNEQGIYPVGLEKNLNLKKQRLLAKLKPKESTS